MIISKHIICTIKWEVSLEKYGSHANVWLKMWVTTISYSFFTEGVVWRPQEFQGINKCTFPGSLSLIIFSSLSVYSIINEIYFGGEICKKLSRRILEIFKEDIICKFLIFDIYHNRRLFRNFFITNNSLLRILKICHKRSLQIICIIICLIYRKKIIERCFSLNIVITDCYQQTIIIIHIKILI